MAADSATRVNSISDGGCSIAPTTKSSSKLRSHSSRCRPVPTFTSIRTLRKALLKSLQVGGKQVPRGGLSGADAQIVRDLAEVLFHEGVGKPVDTLHDGHGETVEPLAQSVEGETRALTPEQRCAELLFQPSYLRRDRRLARHELLGRSRNVPDTSHLAERPELLETTPSRGDVQAVTGDGG